MQFDQKYLGELFPGASCFIRDILRIVSFQSQNVLTSTLSLNLLCPSRVQTNVTVLRTDELGSQCHLRGLCHYLKAVLTEGFH